MAENALMRSILVGTGWWLAAAAFAACLALPAVSDAALRSRLQGVLLAADLKSTQVSVMITDARTGEVLAAHSPDMPMIPASNMKLITTAAALHRLGPDFAFRTQLRLTRDHEDNHVLLLRGDGDPAFGDPTLLRTVDRGVEDLLDEWVAAVRAAGVRSIAWVIADDRVFDRTFVHETWPQDQLHYHYCAQVSGLNFHGNVLEVFPRPTNLGQSPSIEISPQAPFLSISNRAVTSNDDLFGISRSQGTNEFTVWGRTSIRRTAGAPVTVHDPALFFARVLAHRLEAAGVTVKSIGRPAEGKRLPDGQLIHETVTPLSVVLERSNKDSSNLSAESLLKRMGRQLTGSPGSWENGAAAVRMVLQGRLGPASASVVVADGSGLSRDNQVTARVIAELLGDLYRDDEAGPMFLRSLAVGGEDGTLRTRFREPMNGVVLAKSGYINRVSALSGYLVRHRDALTLTDDAAQTELPDAVAFSMLFNDFRPPVYNHQIKALQEAIIRLIDQSSDRPDPALGG